MASRGFARPAVFWDSSNVDVSQMYANGFEPHIVYDPSFNEVYKEIGGSSTNILPALGEGQGTFTRASTATYLDDDGNYFSVSTHEPRVFDGKQLMEPQRTNELLRSEELDAGAWSTWNQGSISVDAATAPDGTTSADGISGDADAISDGVFQSITVADDSESYVLSAWAKKANGAKGELDIRFTGGTTEIKGGATIDFDLDADPIITAEGSAVQDSGVVTGDDGWHRIWVKAANNGTGNTSLGGHIRIKDENQSNVRLYYWGAQVEKGDFLTSYIPTSGSTVTRSEERLDPLSDYTRDYDASEGLTLYIKSKLIGADGNLATGGDAILLRVRNNNNQLVAKARSVDNKLWATSEVDGSFEEDGLNIGHSTGDTIEIAVREQSSGYAVQYSINGGSVQNVSLSALSTNHTDGLTWNETEIRGFGGEVHSAHVARGDITLDQMRTLVT